ncbi:hypothetical protein EJ02DRAFT_506899 [Clathrospora elynae]|uniref:Azaphilone pigments biosynthesis cluster protein L N-terminal domain-containing protein n=1 Tax=Clathrospora elynae TaxID=706981 RepID=A0A6A5S8B3_9PLEO|nr:hypothetical protein EJ02DRAFT_506899 [Clathrospora elynae]
MSDPLSITASVVSITVPALHVIRLLYEDLQQLKDAPKIIKRLSEYVHSVDAALKLLQGVEEREWNLLDTRISEESKTTINSCTQACELFRSELQRWTRHSEDGRLAWRDRTNVGFFKQSQIKAMSEQLQNCKISIGLVVNTATLYISVRHTHITEDIRKTISTAQAEVKGAITTTENQLVAIESKLKDLSPSSDDEEAARPEEDKVEALRQLEVEHKALEASYTLLHELSMKTQEEAVAKAAAKNQGSSTTVTNVTFGSQNRGLQAGVINGGTVYLGK